MSMVFRCAYGAEEWSFSLSLHPAIAPQGISSPWRSRVQNRLQVEQNWKHGICTQRIVRNTPKVAVSALQFSVNLLAIGLHTGTIKLWDMAKHLHVATLKHHTREIRALQLTTGCQHIISASDKVIKVNSVTSGHCVLNLEGHNDWVRSIVFDPFRDVIMSGSDDDRVKIWDLETGSCLQTILANGRGVLALSHEDDRLITGSFNGILQQWDLRSALRTRMFVGHTGRVHAVALQKQRVVSASRDVNGCVKIWQLTDAQCTQTIEDAGYGLAVVGKMVISGSNDCNVKCWHALTGEYWHTFVSSRSGIGALHCDDTRLVSGDYGGEIRISDFSSKSGTKR